MHGMAELEAAEELDGKVVHAHARVHMWFMFFDPSGLCSFRRARPSDVYLCTYQDYYYSKCVK